MSTPLLLPLASGDVGNPTVNILIFALFVAATLAIVIRASRNNKTAADYYAARPELHRPAERHRDLRRLPVRRVVPRDRGRDRDQRLRRVPLLDRLPGRLAGGAAAGRRTDPEHGPVHDGRRAVVPAQGTAGPDGGRDLDAGSLLLLPAGADGRRGRPGRSPAGHRQPGRAESRDRGRRPDHDHLRAGRRHEGHHLGPDHQGCAAGDRCRSDDAVGVGEVQLQPVVPPRRSRRQEPGRREAARSGTAVRRDGDQQTRLHLARPGPGAGDGRVAARVDALLHRSDLQGSASQRDLGDLDHRRLLPVHAGARVRRRGAGGSRRDPGSTGQGELGGPSARLRAGRGTPAGVDLRSRLRHHPGGGSGPDDHREHVVRA